MQAFSKIIVVLSIFFLGFLAYIVPKSVQYRAAAEQVAEKYYSRYGAGDAVYIYANLLDSSLKAATKISDISAAMEKTGKPRSRKKVSFKLMKLDGAQLYMRFEAEYEKARTTDQFMMVKEGGEYRLTYLPNDTFPCAGR